MRLSVIFFHIVLVFTVFQTTLTAALSTNGNEVVSTDNGSGEMSLDNSGDSENATAKPHKEAVSNKKTSNKRKKPIRFLTKRKIFLIIGIGLSLLIVFGIGAAISSQKLHDESDNDKSATLGTNHANAASQSSHLRKQYQKQDKRRRDKEEGYTLAYDKRLQKVRNLVENRRLLLAKLESSTGMVLAESLENQQEKNDFIDLREKMGIDRNKAFKLSSENIAEKLENRTDIDRFFLLIDSIEKILKRYEDRDKENHRKRIKSVLESDEWVRVKAATNEELSALLENEKDKIALATVSVVCGGKELKDLDVESAVTGLESSDIEFLMRVTKELAQKLEAAEKQISARDVVARKNEALECPLCLEEYKDLCGENEECMVFSLCGDKNHNICNKCYCTYKEPIEGEQSNEGEQLIEIPKVIKPCPLCQKPTIEASIIHMKFIKATGELR